MFSNSKEKGLLGANTLKVNVVANFIGAIWTGLCSMIFVPIYLRYIGIEAYGLIGVFMSIQVFFVLLDLGLSPTFNREMARMAGDEKNAQLMHDTMRTLEVPNWAAAAFIALFLSAISPLIGSYWVNPVGLSRETIVFSLILMSLAVALQFLATFYSGGLQGMQRQLSLNVINIVYATLRGVGAIMILAFVSSTIEAFLVWQGLVTLLQLVSVCIVLRISLPVASERPHFKKDLLKKLWRFAAGMTGITLLSLILVQTDRVILGRMLSLEDFGYYALALAVSSIVSSTIVGSITNTVYPRYSYFVSVNDESSLRNFYHQSSQILFAILFPVVLVIGFFSYPILLIWTGDEKIAANTYILLSLTIASSGFAGIAWLPYHLQLAHGWTRLSFFNNLVAIVIVIPVMIVAVNRYGAIGGATVFMLVNASNLFAYIFLMHRRILRGERANWYLRDLLPPALVCVSIVAAAKYFFDLSWSRPVIVLYVAATLVISFLACIAILPHCRRLIEMRFLKRSKLADQPN